LRPGTPAPHPDRTLIALCVMSPLIPPDAVRAVQPLTGLSPLPASSRALKCKRQNRVTRYDETGLIWLLVGGEVVALTAATAAVQNPTGSITIYRRHSRPALGPVGDSLDDFTA
jgi:hypothetical protein